MSCQSFPSDSLQSVEVLNVCEAPPVAEDARVTLIDRLHHQSWDSTGKWTGFFSPTPAGKVGGWDLCPTEERSTNAPELCSTRCSSFFARCLAAKQLYTTARLWMESLLTHTHTHNVDVLAALFNGIYLCAMWPLKGQEQPVLWLTFTEYLWLKRPGLCEVLPRLCLYLYLWVVNVLASPWRQRVQVSCEFVVDSK